MFYLWHLVYMQVFAFKNVYVQVELRNRGEEQGNWMQVIKQGKPRKLTHFARNVETHAIEKGKAYNYTDITKKLQNLKLTTHFFQRIIEAEKEFNSVRLSRNAESVIGKQFEETLLVYCSWGGYWPL